MVNTEMKKLSLTLDTSCVISLLHPPEDSKTHNKVEAFEKLQ